MWLSVASGAGETMQEPSIIASNSVAHAMRRAQWRILFATMFCYLFYYTGRQTFGFAMPGIESELGIDKATLGWINAALLWSYAIGQAINGNLGDKFGGRTMMSAGAVLSCALNWLMSFAQGVGGLATAWSLNGFAQSMGWAPGSRVLSNWWGSAERGRVYGAYVFAAGMSTVLTYGTSSLILALGLDWRWIFRIPVLLMLCGGITYFLVVRDRPEDEGFPPIDDEPDPDGSTQASPPGPTSDPVETEEGMFERYRSVLSHRRFLLASLSIGFQSLARYGLLIWVPVHMLGADWKQDVYGKWVALALPLGMAVGALASGWLSDRVLGGSRSGLVFSWMSAAGLTAIAMYFLSENLLLSVPLLFLCGFFTYGPQSAFWALCPDLLGHRRAGTGTGIMNTFAYVFAGLGEPFIGWVIQSNSQETALVFTVVATSCFASAVLALGVRR
jgi:OPA family glycerol-3-phosphate transporter-like MFS transporter